MAKIKIKRHKDIDIDRNVIEQSVMTVQDKIKKHKKLVLLGILGLFVLTAFAITVLVYFNNLNHRTRVAFEKVIEEYQDALRTKANLNFDMAVKRIKSIVKKDKPLSKLSKVTAFKAQLNKLIADYEIAKANNRNINNDMVITNMKKIASKAFAQPSALYQFEEAINDYQEAHKNKQNMDVDAVIKKLKKVANMNFFGYAHRMSFYTIGNLYYKEKKFKEAHTYLLKFARKDSSHLAPLAMIKAALALENLKTLPKAVALLKEVEDSYDDTLMYDQILYHKARLFKKQGNTLAAISQYNKIIMKYPKSIYAKRAKNQIFLINLKKAQ